jgi:hypothetical protein
VLFGTQRRAEKNTSSTDGIEKLKGAGAKGRAFFVVCAVMLFLHPLLCTFNETNQRLFLKQKLDS